MSEKTKKQQVILKRNIITKAVVTPKFKSFLNNELQENIKFYKKRVTEISAQLNSLGPNDPSAAQLQVEQKEAQNYITSEASQKQFINSLELKSLYSQGPVEGFVTVTVGDNLYEKLGGIEIVVEDGIVKKISSTPSQFQKVTGWCDSFSFY